MLGTAIEQMDAAATTTIVAGETMPAVIAAWPKTRPPTIDIVAPIARLICMLACISIKNANDIISTSSIMLKGTPAREAAIFIARL